jgi:hypothetical protein
VEQAVLARASLAEPTADDHGAAEHDARAKTAITAAVHVRHVVKPLFMAMLVVSRCSQTSAAMRWSPTWWQVK